MRKIEEWTKQGERSESCENCGSVIGKLEVPHAWKEHVVCGECYRRLSGSGAASSQVLPVQASRRAEPVHINAVFNAIALPDAIAKNTCPQCQSEDIAKCSAAYEGGTSVTRSVTSGAGIIGREFGVMQSSSKGISQTNLAARCAPPPEPKEQSGMIHWAGFWIGLALLIAVFVKHKNYEPQNFANPEPESSEWMWGMAFGGVIMIAGAAIGMKLNTALAKDIKSARRNAAIDRTAWRRKWVCLRCGELFYITGPKEIETEEDYQDAEEILAKRLGPPKVN